MHGGGRRPITFYYIIINRNKEQQPITHHAHTHTHHTHTSHTHTTRYTIYTYYILHVTISTYVRYTAFKNGYVIPYVVLHGNTGFDDTYALNACKLHVIYTLHGTYIYMVS